MIKNEKGLRCDKKGGKTHISKPIKSMSTKSWKEENSMRITVLKCEHKNRKVWTMKRRNNPSKFDTNTDKLKIKKNIQTSWRISTFNHWIRGSKEYPLRWLKVDNILIHKYIKTYLKITRILCNRLKNNRIKQKSTIIKIRKRNKT